MTEKNSHFNAVCEYLALFPGILYPETGEICLSFRITIYNWLERSSRILAYGRIRMVERWSPREETRLEGAAFRLQGGPASLNVATGPCGIPGCPFRRTRSSSEISVIRRNDFPFAATVDGLEAKRRHGAFWRTRKSASRRVELTRWSTRHG